MPLWFSLHLYWWRSFLQECLPTEDNVELNVYLGGVGDHYPWNVCVCARMRVFAILTDENVELNDVYRVCWWSLLSRECVCVLIMYFLFFNLFCPVIWVKHIDTSIFSALGNLVSSCTLKYCLREGVIKGKSECWCMIAHDVSLSSWNSNDL